MRASSVIQRAWHIRGQSKLRSLYTLKTDLMITSKLTGDPVAQ